MGPTRCWRRLLQLLSTLLTDNVVVSDIPFRECFLHQPGRRFFFGMALWNNSFQLTYFDRSGAVECAPLDIHAHADTFVQVIRMLGDLDLSNLGFDPSMYWDSGRRYVDMRGLTPGTRKISSVTYEIERVMYQRPQLVDRGTTCWIVKRAGSGERVLMKDSWLGDDPDDSVFLTLARKQGIEDVTRYLFLAKSPPKNLLTISSLRRDQCLTGDLHQDRTFSRTIRELQGPSLLHFDSGLHLVEALRDAIDGASAFFNTRAPILTERRSAPPPCQGWYPSSGHLPRQHPI